MRAPLHPTTVDATSERWCEVLATVAVQDRYFTAVLWQPEDRSCRFRIALTPSLYTGPRVSARSCRATREQCGASPDLVSATTGQKADVNSLLSVFSRWCQE